MEYAYCLCEGKAVVSLARTQKNQPGKCPKCSSKKLSGLFFASPYKNQIIKKLIKNFKYEPYTKSLALPLAGLIAEHFIISGRNTEEFWQNAVLIPVPISKEKQRKRGYNQSEELAKELSKIITVPLLAGVLVKTRKTESQMNLKKEARQKNLLNAFAVTNTGCLYNKKVFLVDDVYTTGNTMEECVKTLRKAGAKSVWGITIAREE